MSQTLTFIEAAKAVLEQAGEPLHSKAITSRALELGLETSGKTSETRFQTKENHARRRGFQRV
ncbi:MAG: hypothetical protein H6737_06920 [Alphaproteobacteria bacterium]|nr:hypothetical protein [Alphaproteobacteria bacterium]